VWAEAARVVLGKARDSSARPLCGGLSGRRPVLSGVLIRRMAGRYGDDEIARVLNKLGRRTGKGKRWSQERVATARRNHGIAGQTRAAPDPEILSLGRAAKEFHVSDTTLKRLVASGLLTVAQVAPWAPWKIRRADLDADPIRGILERLRRTDELVLPGMEYAHRRDSDWHVEAHRHVAELAEGPVAWAIPWPCIHEFLGVVTHPRIFAPPSTLGEAIAQAACANCGPPTGRRGEGERDGGAWPRRSCRPRSGRVSQEARRC